jgi:hypothetical protein
MSSLDKVSTYTVITGPRGSAKSLFQSSKVCERLIKQYLNEKLRKVTNTHVWTNYPVAFYYNSPIEKRVVRLESEPLNLEALMLWEDDFCNGWVFIDEMDQWFDRQEWNTTAAKLTNKGMTQIRKKKLSICGTIQNLEWLNNRGNFQVDIIVQCREMVFTPWGRKMKFKPGQCSSLVFLDKSGVCTGYKYDETHQSYKMLFWGERFWDTYDTNFQYNPLENSVKYKLKVPTKIIEVGGQDGDIQGAWNSDQADPDVTLFSHMVRDYMDDGVTTVSKEDLWTRAREMGWNGEFWKAGQILRKLGVSKTGYKGNKYQFNPLGGGGTVNPSNTRSKVQVST